MARISFFNTTPSFDFLGQRKLWLTVSTLVIAISLGSLFTKSLNFGIDFTGGVLVEVGYDGPANLDTVRSELAAGGFGDALVQNFGTAQDVLIRMAPQAGDTDKVSNDILAALAANGNAPDMRRVEFVGPQVGEELTISGALATMVALVLIFAYVWFRFHWKFSAGAVAALTHDVIITLGVFSLLQLPFDLTVLAAVLAVIGYSLNDTIVVFDRCRENFRRSSVGGSVETINRAINENLSRTLVTSLTTLLALLALRLFGGEAMAGFSTALIVGVIVGTYSSIYIASPVSLALRIERDDVMPQVDNNPRGDDGAVV